MIVKVDMSPEGNIVAVCDKAALGKRFDGGKIFIDASSDFYAGEEMSEESVIRLLKNSYVSRTAHHRWAA